jgi:hypothetical protein
VSRACSVGSPPLPIFQPPPGLLLGSLLFPFRTCSSLTQLLPCICAYLEFDIGHRPYQARVIARCGCCLDVIGQAKLSSIRSLSSTPTLASHFATSFSPTRQAQPDWTLASHCRSSPAPAFPPSPLTTSCSSSLAPSHHLPACCQAYPWIVIPTRTSHVWPRKQILQRISRQSNYWCPSRYTGHSFCFPERTRTLTGPAICAPVESLPNRANHDVNSPL